MNYYQKWFSPVVLLSVLINLSFAIPAVFFPAWLLGALGLPSSYQDLWLRGAGLVLFFLSLTHVPAAFDPWRYKVNTFVLVFGQLLFGIFWLWFVFFAGAPRGYFILGVIDFSLGIVLVILFFLLLREEKKRSYGF